MTTPANDTEGSDIFTELDQTQARGKGSCCTGWSFAILLGVILVLGLIVLIRLMRW